MSYFEQNLLHGEKIVYHTRLHWIRVVKEAAVLAGCLIVLGISIFIVMRKSEGLLASLAAVGVLMSAFASIAMPFRVIAAVFELSTGELAVTNKRVLGKIGFFRRRCLEILLPKVEGIFVEQPLLGRMLGYGPVTVQGTGGTSEGFSDVRDPLVFRRHVQEQVAAAQLAGLGGALPIPLPGMEMLQLGELQRLLGVKDGR